MIYRITPHCFILRTTSTLVADKIRIGTAKSCGARSLVGIYHNAIVCCFLEGVEVVVVHPLPVVVFATREDVAHITTLNGVITIVHHKLISGIDIALIVACGSAGFMVHNHFYAASFGVFVDTFHIEVGIRRNEVEDVIFFVTVPVLPTFIPTLNEESLETIGRRKVDVTFHIGSIGCMTTIGACFCIVGLTNFH